VHMTHLSLPARLRMARALHGWTLREVSNRAGIRAASLSHIERGTQRPHVSTLAKLAHGYDLPLEELLELYRGEVDEGKAGAGQESRQPEQEEEGDVGRESRREGSLASFKQEREALMARLEEHRRRVEELETKNLTLLEGWRAGEGDFFYRVLADERDQWRNRAVELEQENADLRRRVEDLTTRLEELRAAIGVARARED